MVVEVIEVEDEREEAVVVVVVVDVDVMGMVVVVVVESWSSLQGCTEVMVLETGSVFVGSSPRVLRHWVVAPSSSVPLPMH